MLDFGLEEVKELAFTTKHTTSTEIVCPGCGTTRYSTDICGCCGTQNTLGSIVYGYGAVEYSAGNVEPIESIAEAYTWEHKLNKDPDSLILKGIAVVSIFVDHVQTIFENYEGEVSRYVYYPTVF